MKLFVVDNYDSFIYNLVHYIRELAPGCSIKVARNDSFTLEEVADYDKILLSPGPGVPDEAGLMKPLIERYRAEKSMLGVCLGHQAIAEVFGAKLENLDQVFHGVAHSINIDKDEPLFSDQEEKIEVGRYHSWSVSEKDFPEALKITAKDEDGRIMALSHSVHDIKGMQFHPESILTPSGKNILKNWIQN